MLRKEISATETLTAEKKKKLLERNKYQISVKKLKKNFHLLYRKLVCC